VRRRAHRSAPPAARAHPSVPGEASAPETRVDRQRRSNRPARRIPDSSTHREPSGSTVVAAAGSTTRPEPAGQRATDQPFVSIVRPISIPASHARTWPMTRGSMAYTRPRWSTLDQVQRINPARERIPSCLAVAGLPSPISRAICAGRRIPTAMSATIARLVGSASSSIPTPFRLGIVLLESAGGSQFCRTGLRPRCTGHVCRKCRPTPIECDRSRWFEPSDNRPCARFNERGAIP